MNLTERGLDTSGSEKGLLLNATINKGPIISGLDERLLVSRRLCSMGLLNWLVTVSLFPFPEDVLTT
jgi:hypothetical protein